MKRDEFKLAEYAQHEYIKNGIATVQDGASSKEIIDLFKALAQQQKLKIDVVAYPVFDAEPKKLMEENKDYAKNIRTVLKSADIKCF